MPRATPRFTRLTLLLGCLLLVLTACSADVESGSAGPQDDTSAASQSTNPSDGDDGSASDGTIQQEPQRFVPSGLVGDAKAYDELIDELTQHVPAELRASIPWPDLRNPDPAEAQQDIFALWIWMLENHPEPRLIDALAAPDSPDRATVAGIFGDLNVSGQLIVRPGAPYRAYDHQAVTWESAGLPLWITRDVPEPAVVVYYSDDSGPSQRIDQATGFVVGESPSPGVRDWLAIMVETEVGWQLWQDVEIDPNDAELEMPNLNKPSPDAEQNRRDL